MLVEGSLARADSPAALSGAGAFGAVVRAQIQGSRRGRLGATRNAAEGVVGARLVTPEQLVTPEEADTERGTKNQNRLGVVHGVPAGWRSSPSPGMQGSAPK